LFGSRKYPYPPKRGSLGIPRGRGQGGNLILKKSMNENWNFQRDGKVQTKNPCMGGESMDVFWNKTIC